MKFRNYCIVALGDVDGILPLLSKISETEIRKLAQTGVLICTFSSVVEAAEIKELINRDKRTFFIFEVGADNSAYQIGREEIHNQLFSFMEDGGDELLSLMTNKLINDIKSTNDSQSGITISKSSIEEDEDLLDVSKLNKNQKQKEIDNLLDKGLDNLSEKEKEFLDLLTKNL